MTGNEFFLPKKIWNSHRDVIKNHEPRRTFNVAGIFRPSEEKENILLPVVVHPQHDQNCECGTIVSDVCYDDNDNNSFKFSFDSLN